MTNHGGALVFVLDTSRMRDLTEPLVAQGRIGPAAASILPRGNAT